MKKPYTLLDHTADLRIRVTGESPADLFRNAGLAMFDQIVEPIRVTAEETLSIRVDGADRADLLVNFLRELLYLWTGTDHLVAAIRIDRISQTRLEARISVGAYRPDRHAVLHEIKAVTYHQLEVVPSRSGWQASVVFDI